MRHHLTVRGPVEAKDVRKWLDRPLARLNRGLARFPADAIHLRTVVREVEGKPRAEASLALQLPSRTLAASEEGADARTALWAAFDELERLLAKEKARLRRADTWRRSRDAFQRELLDLAAGRAQRPLSVDESELVVQQLAEVEAFVRRELGWLEANRDLVPGEIDPRDVVDAAFLRAYRSGRTPPTRQDLLQHASAALRSELARARSAREELHLEEDVPGIPPQRAVSTLGSEIHEFHQPDDDLQMEDLLAGLSRTPEQIEATAELAEALRDALGALPASWRQAFHLAQVDGLDPVEIAEALEVGNEEVPDLLTHARAFLRDRLAQAGLLEGL